MNTYQAASLRDQVMVLERMINTIRNDNNVIDAKLEEVIDSMHHIGNVIISDVIPKAYDTTAQVLCEEDMK